MDNQIKCKPLKKTKDPKCDDQPHCIWEKGKGCLPKIQVRTPVEVINPDSPIIQEVPREEKTKKREKPTKIKIPKEKTPEDAMEFFYSLKKKYEQELLKKKRNIYLNSNLTKKEKKQNIRQIVSKCIICNKDGGIIFSEKNRTLKAICGAEEPCNLNIEIKIGTYVQKEHLIYNLKKSIMYLKETIIITKLNILFRLEKEDVMVSEFDKLKEEYEEQQKQLLGLYRFIEDKLNIANKKVVLNSAKQQLQKEIGQFKQLLEEAQREQIQNNNVHAKHLLKEAVEKYSTDIQDLQSNIRDVEYGYLFIEESTPEAAPKLFNVSLFNEFRLYQEKYSLQDTEIQQEPAEVIYFKK